jgi:hypothetical protein
VRASENASVISPSTQPIRRGETIVQTS